MRKKTTFNSKLIYLIPFFVLSTLFTQCGKEDSTDIVAIPEPVTIFEFSAGDYVGVWNSSTASQTFTDFPISARIVDLSDGNFEGTFYATNVFSSCCSNEDNDGSIEFKIKDNLVSDFIWNDIIPDCEGTFTGRGNLSGNNSLLINLVGTDCDGTHSGSINLKMQ